MSTLVDIFTGIGNAIREKDGSTDVIPVVSMADRIKSIETGSNIVFTTLSRDNIEISSGGYLCVRLPSSIANAQRVIAMCLQMHFHKRSYSYMSWYSRSPSETYGKFGEVWSSNINEDILYTISPSSTSLLILDTGDNANFDYAWSNTSSDNEFIYGWVLYEE